MKILIWTTIIISYCFIILTVIPFNLFITKTTIINQLDQEVFVTPLGRERSTITTTIPLKFRFPSITNPFNKRISISPMDSIVLYHDNDVCLFDGLLITRKDSAFYLNSEQEQPNNYVINESILTDNSSKILESKTEYRFNDFIGFIFQILLLGYGPIITIMKLRKKYR